MSVHDEVYWTMFAAMLYTYRDEIHREASVIDDGEDIPPSHWEPWMRMETRAIPETNAEGQRLLRVIFRAGTIGNFFHSLDVVCNLDNVDIPLEVSGEMASEEYTVCDVINSLIHLMTHSISGHRKLDILEGVCCYGEEPIPVPPTPVTPDATKASAKVLAFPQARR